MISNTKHLTEINSPNQTIRARVELYKGSTLEQICTCSDILSDFTITKSGESKFFGFGVCQKATVKLIDIERELNITKEHRIEIAFGVDGDFIYTAPVFYVDDVARDENSNLITLTAYDALYSAASHTVAELGLPSAYTLRAVAEACATLLGLPLTIDSAAASAFDLVYPSGANLEGKENIRTVLNAIAEATQTIYFINANWELTFKRLDKESAPVYTIEREKYIEFTNNGARALAKIAHITELGDNIISATDLDGETQYIRNNPFWELREDIAELVDSAVSAAAGISIQEFSCYWIGNYLLEIGDKIALITEDNNSVNSFVFDDTITFDGTIEQRTEWKYEENKDEKPAAPTTIGEVINKTTATVDKINKTIELIASETSENTSNIASLQITTGSISASVKSVEANTEELTESLGALSKEVSAKLDENGVKLTIEQQLKDGVGSVKTSTTGYTFNDDGLSISKSDSEISTAITEDGMTVYKKDEAVLKADNQGVKAEDLHATTYLIVGAYSRFENFGSGRTGCFWIGN